MVATGRIPEGPEDRTWVENDHREGARRVLNHLAEVGCTRPALLTTAIRQSYVEDTVSEYEAWCLEHDIEPHVSKVSGNPTEKAGEAAVADLLSGRPRPDAIYATLDRRALSALHACHDRGLRVPGDLAVAAVTDSLYLRTANPTVTALDLNGAEIGQRATELLVTLANGEEPASERVIVSSSLRVRASTGRADTGYRSE